MKTELNYAYQVSLLHVCMCVCKHVWLVTMWTGAPCVAADSNVSQYECVCV